MSLALVTLGSLGDVHPLLGVGRAMFERGHQVTLFTNAVFEDLVRAQGLEFVAVGTPEQQYQTINHPKLWHPVDGLGVMWRYMLRPALWPTVQALHAWHQQVDTGDRLLVVANPVAFGARLAAEAWGLKLVSTYTAPTILRTSLPPMRLAQWQLPAAVPGWVPKLAWAVLDRFKLQPLVLPALNALRIQLGLPLITESVFGAWMHAPIGGLTLFPPWFAESASDWPTQVKKGNFPLFDDGVPLDADLLAFLDQGTPPVVVMPGTAQKNGAALFRAAAHALSALGLRGVLLGNVPTDVLAHAVVADLWCGAHQSFAQLLPRSSAVLHHAGVGCSAQALRAGIPQLLWPQAYDQFDNAYRLKCLGVAACLSGDTPEKKGMERDLARLMASDATFRAKTVAAEYMQHTQQNLVDMCLQLESWA